MWIVIMKKNDAKEALYKYAQEKKIVEDQEYTRELIIKCREGIDHKAMAELSRRYFEGDGIEQNYVDAFYWVYKSEVLGNPDAPELRKEIENVASDIQKIVAQKMLTEEG